MKFINILNVFLDINISQTYFWHNLVYILSRPFGVASDMETLNMDPSLAILPNSILRHSTCLAVPYWSKLKVSQPTIG